MKQFLLYGHGGSYNHGAEAIVKCTIRQIREETTDSCIALVTHFPEQDKEFNVPAGRFISPAPEDFEAEKNAPVGRKEGLARKMYAEALETITSDTVLYSVGGDNFCYNNWYRITVFQKEAVKKGAKSILWSCSIDPELISPEMVEVLNTFDIITARESLTYNALKKHCVIADLRLVRDVAFTLESEKTAMPPKFENGGFIGVNISPLIIRREAKSGIVIKNYIELIHYAVKNGLNVALIPHVVMPMDNDYSVHYRLFNDLPSEIKKRVWLVPENFSAARYKYIISSGKALIAARTHASIAAYSSGVPCIVVGYSVKSAGIARDLGFEKFVIDIKKMTDKNVLKRAFQNDLQNHFETNQGGEHRKID